LWRSSADADIRTKLLNLIDSKSNSLTIEDFTIEYQRLINLKIDILLMQNLKSGIVTTVAKIASKQNKTGKFKKEKRKQSGAHPIQLRKN